MIQHKHPVLSLPKFAIMTTGKRENVAAKYPQKNCPTKIIWWDSLVLRVPPDLVGGSRLSNIWYKLGKTTISHNGGMIPLTV